METATKVNLFAANTKVKETKAKPEKEVIKVEALEEKIQRYNTLKSEIETREGELSMLAGDIKEVGRSQYLKKYFQLKRQPDSFKLQDNTDSQVLFIVMDKYTKVETEKANLLRKYDGLVEEKTVYTFNAELVEKYSGVLSEFIMTSPDIEEADRTNLIKGEMTYNVPKGAVSRLIQYVTKMKEVFELINPICALK